MVSPLTSLYTLASGSSGNALLITMSGARFLVDAGISCRKITQRLQALGLGLPDLDGLFITHAHTDHINGLKTMLKRVSFPIFATWETLCCLPGEDSSSLFRPIKPGVPFSVSGCSVTAISTSHDVPGSCGYRFDGPDGSVGILTDTGYVTEAASSLLPGVRIAVLEANHDVEALSSGPYPHYLKKRILGRQGHLSNDDAAEFAVTLAENGANEIILAHLSLENNTPAMARRTVETALAAANLTPALSVAPRDALGEAHVLGERDSVCSGLF